MDYEGMFSRFFRSEDGATSWFGVVWLVIIAMFLGLAVDVANAIQQRTHLQTSAEAAAHAAIYTRDGLTTGLPIGEEEAKQAAITIARANMPSGRYGEVLDSQNVVFGTWDDEANVFTPSAGSRSAVRVVTQQREGNGNPVATFLLGLAGLDYWNVAADAAFSTYTPACLREGFVAEKMIDLQSNNSYFAGFCLHSNDKISVNSNNSFEDGTVVSLPNFGGLQLPNSGFATNVGLESALTFGTMEIKILKRMREEIIPNLRYPTVVRDPNWLWYRDYITSNEINTLTSKFVQQADIKPGQIHVALCSGPGESLTIKANVVIERIVLWTTCPIKFETQVRLEDAVIATTATGDKSISSPSGGTFAVQIGRDDDCAPGGGAQILTMGSMRFPSKIALYGGQLVAQKDISFSSQGDGLQGASMISGGTISGTSNMNMGLCLTGLEDNFGVNYFRMVL